MGSVNQLSVEENYADRNHKVDYRTIGNFRNRRGGGPYGVHLTLSARCLLTPETREGQVEFSPGTSASEAPRRTQPKSSATQLQPARGR